MNCSRCKTGKVFLDTVFSDNVGLETSCLHCGDRKFFSKDNKFGKFLMQQEVIAGRLKNGLSARR